MNIQRMHHEVKLRGNKINSNHYQDLPAAFIDDYLNEAINLFVEQIYDPKPTNRLKLKIEESQQNIDFISNLTINDESIVPTLVSSGIYKIQLRNLSKKYKHLLKLKINTSCGDITVEVENHNEFDNIMKDANRQPSSLWKRAVALFVSNKLTNDDINTDIYIYTGGKFTITGALISYIHEPRKVFFGGYNTLEFINGDLTSPSATSAPINTDLNTNSHTYIVDIACQLIHNSLENINNSQIIESKIQKTI